MLSARRILEGTATFRRRRRRVEERGERGAFAPREERRRDAPRARVRRRQPRVVVRRLRAAPHECRERGPDARRSAGRRRLRDPRGLDDELRELRVVEVVQLAVRQDQAPDARRERRPAERGVPAGDLRATTTVFDRRCSVGLLAAFPIILAVLAASS